jgi:hypothetical protein
MANLYLALASRLRAKQLAIAGDTGAEMVSHSSPHTPCLLTKFQGSRLITLPRELRDEIWRLVIGDNTDLNATQPGMPTPALIRVNRLIRREALEILLKEHRWTCNITNYDGAYKVARFYELRLMFKAACKLGAFSRDGEDKDGIWRDLGLNRFNVWYYGRPNWVNLMRCLKAEYDAGGYKAHHKPEQRHSDHQVLVSAEILLGVMKDKPWEDVEAALEALHAAVASKDRRWA